jgi:hypothetical protein
VTAPLFGNATLAEFKQLQRANMPSAAELIVFAQIRTTGGETGRTPVIVDTVPCRLADASSSSRLVNARPTPEGSYIVFLPFDTDTTNVERVIVSGPDRRFPSWTVQLIVTELEPRSFSASRQLSAKLAPDFVTPATPVATVVVDETPP